MRTQMMEDTFSSISKDVLSLEINTVSVKRLGQQRGWPRLLLVVLQNEGLKRQILARSPRLRQCDTWKSVFITFDLTQQKREENRRLHEELKTRRQNGESNLIIRRGRIVVSQRTNSFTLGRAQQDQSS